MKIHTPPAKHLLLWALFSYGMIFAYGEQRFFGVNLAGADFGATPEGDTNLPGIFNTHYTYPNQDEVDYFRNQKMNIVRLPFRWERLQHLLDSPFNSAELSRLQGFVDTTTAKGMYVLLDPHNYARYHSNIIGSDEVPYTSFADFWGRLADIFKDNPRVIFGLMNEPTQMRTDHWRIAANTAIAKIREKNAANLILIPGNGYTGGHSWLQNWYAQESPNSDSIGVNGYRVGSNAEEMLNIIDPLNNYAFDIHQYLDQDFSGRSEICVSSTIGSESLASVTAWLKNHDQKAFLGEFGSGTNSTCLAALKDITSYIDDRPNEWLGWAYWAAGPWWNDHFMALEPANITSGSPIDRPQLANLIFSLEDPEIILPLEVSISPDPMQLNFSSLAGQSYQIQTSIGLIQNSWHNVGSPIAGDGSLMEIDLLNIDTMGIHRFYRLKVTNQ